MSAKPLEHVASWRAAVCGVGFFAHSTDCWAAKPSIHSAAHPRPKPATKRRTHGMWPQGVTKRLVLCKVCATCEIGQCASAFAHWADGSGALWVWMGCKAGFATHKPLLGAKKPTPQTATLHTGATHQGFCRLSLSRELQRGQVGVHPAQSNQFGVGALLDQPPVVEHHNAIGLLHRGQAVRDDQCGAITHGAL
jgi:hypothetical protein